MGWTETLPSGRIRAGYRLNGKKQPTKVFDYLFEAQEWIAQMEGASSAAAPAVQLDVPTIVVDSPTLASYARSYLKLKAPDWEPATLSSTRTHVNYLAAETIGTLRLDQLDRSAVAALHRRMKSAEIQQGQRRNRIKLVRALLRLAASDPTTGVTHAQWQDVCSYPVPAAPRRDVRLVVGADADALLGACSSDVERAFVLLGLDAGLRWGEAAGLCSRGVDLDRGLLQIRQVVESRKGVLRGYAKNKSSDDLVPIVTDRLRDALAALVPNEQGLLLTSHLGTFYKRSTWENRLWIPLVERSGITPPPRFHDLRHTLGSRLAEAGLHTTQIRDVLRHADEATTLRYIHAPAAVELGQRARAALRVAS